MKKNKAFAILSLCACGHALAVQPLADCKPLDANNPIFPVNFCADPTAVVYDGRVYEPARLQSRQLLLSAARNTILSAA